MAEDPVEDFLAREHNDMAGLEDDENPAPVHEHDFSERNGYAEPEESLPADTGYAPNYNQTLPKIEPEKIRKWREEQKERIEKKDAQEAKDIEKMREHGKKELADWYKQRSEQHEKNMKNNRVHDAEFIKERDQELPGQEWERITRLCEFNPKKVSLQKDVSRLRSLLLQLKQNPSAKTPAGL